MGQLGPGAGVGHRGLEAGRERWLRGSQQLGVRRGVQGGGGMWGKEDVLGRVLPEPPATTLRVEDCAAWNLLVPEAPGGMCF